MNISNVIDRVFESQQGVADPDPVETKRLICEFLLEELKATNTEELTPHFRSLDLKRPERQVVLTLSFPWDVESSNFLGRMSNLSR
jgi:hypothetical protein